MNLAWATSRNLENSCAEFLQDAVNTASLTIPDNNGNAQPVAIRVGYEFNTSWELPVISMYVDSKTAPRLSIGSNRRFNTYLVVIDIRTLDKGSQLDLTEWLQETINDGFPYYDYSVNAGDPSNPIKVANGRASIDFISNLPLNIGDDADLFDRFRQNITLSITLSNG